MDYISRLSRTLDILGGVPITELQKAKELSKPREVSKGSLFLRAGEIPEYIAYVQSGLFRLFYIDYDGNEVTKHFSFENSMILSYSAFLLRSESRFFIEALEDSVICALRHNDYMSLLNGHPCWGIVARKIAELLFILKERRESELLLMDAESRYRQFLEDFPQLVPRIRQNMLASYLRIQPETLSRLKRKIG